MDGIADGAHPSFWHWERGTTLTHKLQNIQIWKGNDVYSYRKGPNKADLSSLYLIACTVSENDPDLCGSKKKPHKAHMSSRHSVPLS